MLSRQSLQQISPFFDSLIVIRNAHKLRQSPIVFLAEANYPLSPLAIIQFLWIGRSITFMEISCELAEEKSFWIFNLKLFENFKMNLLV